MITVLENSLTRKKHTLNLVDHKGQVFGFNPYPNNKKIKWELHIGSNSMPVLTDKDISIERYIVGAPFHFGNDTAMHLSALDGNPNGIRLELVADNLSTTNQLFIYGEGGEYYCENIGLTEKDLKTLFSKDAIEQWRNGTWAEFYNMYYKNVDWDEMTTKKKLDYLLKKIEKLEEKVNLLGNLK